MRTVGELHIKTASGQRRYDVDGYLGRSRTARTVCYCRVSALKQRDDLQRQVAWMRERYPDSEIIQEIGGVRSGRYSVSNGACPRGSLANAVFILPQVEQVLLLRPAGVGKTFLAQAQGYTAVRADHSVRFLHADDFFRAVTHARVDNFLERAFSSFLSPDLLILDDLGLHRQSAQQNADLYELIIGRHWASSFIITSNSALDRLADAS